MSHRVSFTYDRGWAVQVCRLLREAVGIEAHFRHTRTASGGEWKTYSITVDNPVDCDEAREFMRGWKVATEQLRGNPETFAKGFTAGMRWMLRGKVTPKLAAEPVKQLTKGAVAA